MLEVLEPVELTKEGGTKSRLEFFSSGFHKSIHVFTRKIKLSTDVKYEG
jgi:hypothetical protein